MRSAFRSPEPPACVLFRAAITPEAPFSAKAYPFGYTDLLSEEVEWIDR